MPSDEETICAFMESKPTPNSHGGTGRSGKNWWFWAGDDWYPCDLTLDRLWEVEERLTAAEWSVYDRELYAVMPKGVGYRPLWHATAAQKIKALAQVIGGKRG